MKNMTATTKQLMNFMENNQPLNANNRNLPIANPRPNPVRRPGQAPMGPVTPARAVHVSGNQHPAGAQQLKTAGRIHGESVPQSQQPNEPTSKAQSGEIHTNSQRPPNRPSWAQVAAEPKINSIQPELQARINVTRAALTANGFAPTPTPTRRPDPSVVYFGGVPSGPKGAFRRYLTAEHSVPNWGLLGISFLGEGIAEIITHKPLESRLIAVMRLLGYRHLRRYIPIATTQLTSSKKSSNGEITPPKSVIACATRWTAEHLSCRSAAAKSWYKSKISELLNSYPNLDKHIRVSGKDSQSVIPDARSPIQSGTQQAVRKPATDLRGNDTPTAQDKTLCSSLNKPSEPMESPTTRPTCTPSATNVTETPGNPEVDAGFKLVQRHRNLTRSRNSSALTSAHKGKDTATVQINGTRSATISDRDHPVPHCNRLDSKQNTGHASSTRNPITINSEANGKQCRGLPPIPHWVGKLPVIQPPSTAQIKSTEQPRDLQENGNIGSTPAQALAPLDPIPRPDQDANLTGPPSTLSDDALDARMRDITPPPTPGPTESVALKTAAQPKLAPQQ